MAKEKERKFLVKSVSYRQMSVKIREISQAYLSTSPDATVRVRIDGDKAWLTVKSRNVGDTRNEWEYEIPCEDAREMLKVCLQVPLVKTRWIVPYGGLTWEVDEFHGELEGLTVAEVELPEDFGDKPIEALPDFVGREVTGNPDYYNSNLITKGIPHE